MHSAFDEFLGEDEEAEAKAELPEGMAVILFADIANSTALTEQLGDAAEGPRRRNRRPILPGASSGRAWGRRGVRGIPVADYPVVTDLSAPLQAMTVKMSRCRESLSGGFVLVTRLGGNTSSDCGEAILPWDPY